MTGFFEDRRIGLVQGLTTLGNGISTLAKETLGFEAIPEQSPGLLGAIADTGRSAIDGLFSKERGLLNPAEGYKLAPWHKESVWNIMRHARKAVALVLNTSATGVGRTMGIVSAKWGNALDKFIKGLGSTLLSPILGDFSGYMGISTPSAANDENYSDKASEPTPTPPPEPEEVASPPGPAEAPKPTVEEQKITTQTTTTQGATESTPSQETKVDANVNTKKAA